MAATTACRTGRAGQDERAQRLMERSGQRIHHVPRPVAIGNMLMVIIDDPYQGQRIRVLLVVVGILRKAEHPRRSHMIAGHREVHQEVAGK